MQLFNTQLQSDNLQYGFKCNSSCSHAVFTLRTVVKRYVKDGSTVTLCALDIAKAYNHVDHCALLILLDRHVSSNFIALLYIGFQYAEFLCIGVPHYLLHFSVRAGVRQGGILSPVFFAIYIDVLIAH